MPYLLSLMHYIGGSRTRGRYCNSTEMTGVRHVDTRTGGAGVITVGRTVGTVAEWGRKFRKLEKTIGKNKGAKYETPLARLI